MWNIDCTITYVAHLQYAKMQDKKKILAAANGVEGEER